jgi:nicotinamide-nucleotide adenylyltransferase
MPPSTLTETIGHVHGRFQPFHLEHLAYATWAADRCDRLIVGITNADLEHTTTEEADPKRHEPHHNPFHYHERHRMVRAATAAVDTPVEVMPFPINRPNLWSAYAPDEAVHFVNVLEPWHEVKVKRLRDHGRRVETKDGTRTISGTDIRERMARGDDSWREDVPDAVARVVDDVNGVERVRDLWP